MIKHLLRTYSINVVALWVTSIYIGSFHLANGIGSLFLAGIGFTLIHLTIGPIIRMVLGPVNFLTLGLVGLVVDSVILYVLTIYFPQINTSGWNFSGATIAGVILPPYEFNLITGTILSALVINIIRGGITLLVEE